MSHQDQLEPLECLHSEDTRRRLMITHTTESYWIPSQKKTSQSYKFKEFAKVSNFWILKQTLFATHLLKLLDKMCKYEMDPMGIVEDKERTRFCPQMDRQTDGQGETSIPPFQLRWSGGIMNSKAWLRWTRNHLGQPDFPSGNLKLTISFYSYLAWYATIKTTEGNKNLMAGLPIRLQDFTLCCRNWHRNRGVACRSMQRGEGRPHECVVAHPSMAPDAKSWSTSILPWSFRL